MELSNLSGPVGPYHQASDPLTVLITAQDNQDHHALLALLVAMADDPEALRTAMNQLVRALNTKHRIGQSAASLRLSLVQ